MVVVGSYVADDDALVTQSTVEDHSRNPLLFRIFDGCDQGLRIEWRQNQAMHFFSDEFLDHIDLSFGIVFMQRTFP